MNNEKSIVFIRATDILAPRVNKNIDVALELYKNVVLIGANRSNGKEKIIKDKLEVRIKGIYYPYGSIHYLYGTLIFMWATFWELVKTKPTIIHASDLEATIPSVIYKIFRKVKLIVNVHDNFYARYKVSKTIQNFLKYIEVKFYQRAETVLFPDENRIKMFLPYTFKNPVVTYNTPPDRAYSFYPISSKVKILIAGNQSAQRGLNFMLKAASISEGIEFHFIGTGNKDVLEKIQNTKNVIFHGRKTQQETFDIGSKCHILPIFYDPSVEINRNASSNKQFDALVLGKPIITNSNITVSDFVEKHNSGKIIEYGNYEELLKQIHHYKNNPIEFENTCNNNRKLYEDSFSWEKFKPFIVKEFTL